MSAVADRLGATEDQIFANVDKFGNTSAASVAIALDQAVEQGRDPARRFGAFGCFWGRD